MALPDYHVDEGYSEAPMDQHEQDSEMNMDHDIGNAAPSLSIRAFEEHLLSLPEEQRAEHTYRMLASLRTSTVALIVHRLNPRLHLDPVMLLPPEITAQIFAYLNPDDLVVASTISKPWRERVLDTALWRRKFLNEGWYLNIPKVLAFEHEHGRAAASKPLSRRAVSDADSREPKRRNLSPALPRSEQTTLDVGLRSDAATVGSLRSDVNSRDGTADEDMTTPVEEQHIGRRRRESIDSDQSDDSSALPVLSLARSLMVKTPSGVSRLDYQRLYKIKSQLEENWTQGRYRSFQFPHKDYPIEGHSECVYTIQFSDKYLVSGSRDRTIRIWNLETQRLARKPLTGHTGSVLCLQFDESAEEDIIVSGSSDHTVGIWKFSTGELIKTIANAHSEAVLCVRFDKRYLATCSKDRLIRIYNRKELKPGDEDYPIVGVPGGGRFPEYILDMQAYSSAEEFEHHTPPEMRKPLPPYTLIMTLEHHGAAVNSLHIHNNQLASGSGDRTAKVFNLKTGAIETNCRMHLKGVACIEYDGARLVSGSSDETIRIFDPVTNAQVGILNGHTKLVRTIQADFGDAPGSRETLQDEAMLADQAFLDSQIDGMIDDRLARTEGRRRRPRQVTPVQSAIGAKLPPGGGGNRWSRIVSGSYDETVIVWRREPDGRWSVGQRYKLTDALRAAGPPLIATSELITLQRQRRRHAQQLQTLNAGAATQGLAGNGNTAGAANAAAGVAATTHQGTGAMPMQAQAAQTVATASDLSAATFQAAINPAAQQPVQQNVAQVAAQVAAIHAGQQGNARAFKLQFDARRIICCSQDAKIVGWDFANGNKEITEAAQFFTRTSHYARGG